ncbi:MAG: prepilin-type N-terminal cleavage/methylation domain-containing protein [Candidatus Omnitrophota bacterium]|jgi:prepilin-type N-terminal cleavage/methylation domain-containing protein
MNKKVWGFTLIELIIVIVIIGILAVIAVPKYFANIEKARKAEAFATMRAFRDAQTMHFARFGGYAALVGSGTTTASLSVDVDSDSVADIAVTPHSANFTWATGGSGNAAYVAAIPVAGQGTVTYYMCYASGKADSGAASCP